MTPNTFLTRSINSRKLLNLAAAGAGLGLILMALFLLPIKHPKPEWGPMWMLRPFVMIALAGATGGAFAYLINWYLDRHKAVAVVLSIVVYIIGLWMGTVLGLVGMLWH